MRLLAGDNSHTAADGGDQSQTADAELIARLGRLGIGIHIGVAMLGTGHIGAVGESSSREHAAGHDERHDDGENLTFHRYPSVSVLYNKATISLLRAKCKKNLRKTAYSPRKNSCGKDAETVGDCLTFVYANDIINRIISKSGEVGSSPEEGIGKMSRYRAFIILLLDVRGCGRKVGQSRGRKEEVGILFTYEKKVRALQLYEQTHSVTETIRILGYPERATLYRWISEKGQPEKVRSTKRGENTPDHPRHPSVEVKLQVLHRCFEHGEDVKSVSEEIGYSRASIYNWRRKYLQRGLVALMNPSDDPREELVPGTFSATEDIAELKAQMQEMQMQIDILKETINVLKKDPGVDQTALRNQEKAAIIDALKNKYSLPELLSALHCPRSSYYYQQKRAKKQDKYSHVKEKIKDIFESNHRCYGYRRIYAALKKEGLRLSEKVIRHLMKQVGVQGVNRKKTSYSSYQGEITPAVPNLLKRDFHANRPNEKWLTDITEFAIPAGKVYLSPIIDCFDGMPVCWSIGTSPNAELTNGMLDKAISLLKVGEHPVVHTDRGCHYRWPGWISRMDAAHLHRSMSKKGCSPDNSACEGFFGRMKNEMFYGVSWLNVSIEEFIHTVEDYMVWYREKRIKISLGGLSPLEYRQKLGLSA